MFWVGTSGYNYPEWKGRFYPPGLSSPKMLGFYAARFRTVEINYSFYRMPTSKTLSGWASGTPDGFRFTLKAPRRITHDARLQGCGELVESFCDLAMALGPKLGVLLFQLPPSFKQDTKVLDEFLGWLKPGIRAAVEFRHESWHAEPVYDVLRARRAALCVADSERMSTPVVTTAPFGYFRLRDEGYTDADLTRWADALREQAKVCEDTYAYFKHEEAGKGPELAASLLDRLPA
jgi:uncharacterized protein YecE (DUF72 family)